MARHARHRPLRLSAVIAAVIAPPGTARHIFYREYISLLDARAVNTALDRSHRSRLPVIPVAVANRTASVLVTRV